MLEKILQHSHLGTKSHIIYIIELLSNGHYSIQDLKQACASKEYSFSNSFDGTICLLQWLEVIKISNLVALRNSINLDKFTKEICICLFLKLANENELHHFINSNNLEFGDSIYVKNNRIKLKFSPIRNFLLGLGLFENDDLIQNQFRINENFLEWFYDVAVPLIERSQIKNHTLQSLKNLQDKQSELGAEAEKFVLI